MSDIPEDIFQTACGIVMEAKSLKSMLRHKDVVDAVAIALLAERKRWAQPRQKIIEAMCEIPHSIDDEKVVFRFDQRRPGHNALNQLMTKIESQFGIPNEESAS
jgi:hypothetical protein